MDVVSLKRKMHDCLVDGVINFEGPFPIVVHDLVGPCLRVDGHQSSVVGEVELLLGQFGVFRHFIGFVVVFFVDHLNLVGVVVGHKLLLFDVLFLNIKPMAYDAHDVLIGADGSTAAWTIGCRSHIQICKICNFLKIID